MEIESGKIYFIKDEFTKKYGEKYNLMKNHEDEKSRPNFILDIENELKNMIQ